MSSYLPYNFDFSPRADVFIPDFNFYTNVLGVATQRYKAAVQQAGQLLGQYFLSDLSNPENVKYREEYYNSIKNQIANIAATDLSDPTNFSKLNTIIDSIANDEDILKDMNFTKSYQRNKSYLESLKFNAPDIALKDGVINAHNYLTYDKKMDELLEFERAEFASQKRGQMKAMKSTQVYGLDHVRLANDYLKSLGVKVETIEFLGPTVVDQPSFIVKTNLGELADYNVSNSLNRFLQSNQLVREYFTNQARHDIYKLEYINQKDITQTGVDLLNRLNGHRLTNYDLIKTSVEKSNLMNEEKEKIKSQIEALLAGGTLDGAIKAQDLINKYNNLDRNEKEISATKNETDRITGYIDELVKMANSEIQENKTLSDSTYNKIKMAYLQLQPSLRINEEAFKIGYDWVRTHVDKTIKENALARAHIFGRYGAASAQSGPKTDSSYFVPFSQSSDSNNWVSYFYNTSKEHLDENALLNRHKIYALNDPSSASYVNNINFSKPLGMFSIKSISETDYNDILSSLRTMESQIKKGKTTLDEIKNSDEMKKLGFTSDFLKNFNSAESLISFARDYMGVYSNNNAKVNTTHYSQRSGFLYVPDIGLAHVGVGQVRLFGFLDAPNNQTTTE